MTKAVPWWKGPFFCLSLAHVDADPLSVAWPAGDFVITFEVGVYTTFWHSGGNVLGVSKRSTVELRGTFDTPPKMFSWLNAPQDAVIRSVKVDGQEQIIQGPHTGLVGAVFARQYYIEATRRAWWAWIPRLWEHEDEDDDDYD